MQARQFFRRIACKAVIAIALVFGVVIVAIGMNKSDNKLIKQATTYSDLGLASYKQGDYSKALEWYRKALDISEKVLGKEHPDMAVIYYNIGSVYYK
ncbi:MAG: tetratricopeptide repeat protein, partial [Zoogloeaceae bacterium]|nr:tetratricopeptide repeat protein [Zoogloeaceae bacterium]